MRINCEMYLQMKDNNETYLKFGTELYSVSTGKVSILIKRSRAVVDYIKAMDGFVGVHFAGERGTLWFFNSLNNAKGAKNMLEYRGAKVGNNICRFIVDGCGIPHMDEKWTKEFNGL